MFSTYCISGQPEATQTPISYQIERTIDNGSDRYTDWILRDLSTRGDVYVLFDKLGTISFKSINIENSECEPSQVNTKGKSVLEKIESRILNSLRFPAHWAEEGVAEPNMACKLKANEICKQVFEIYEKMPDRIAPTKEEGVFIAYDSPSGNRTLFIEVYNDLEAGFLLNDNERKQIITSDDITDFEFADIFQLIND
jgi:hypothetical protein